MLDGKFETLLSSTSKISSDLPFFFRTENFVFEAKVAEEEAITNMMVEDFEKE